MEDNEKLKISDYLAACIDFEETQNEEKLKEIQNFIDKVNFREYIPLKEKEIIVMRVMSCVGKDFDAPGSAAFLEMGKVAYGLLSYCTNIEVDVNLIHTLYHSHDLFYQFGLVDAIVTHSGDDYKRLESMLERSVGFDNLYRIMQTASLFDKDSYDEWLKMMNDLKTSLNQDDLKSLLKVTNQEDEVSQEILRDYQEEAIKVVNSELKQERDKVRNAMKILNGDKDGDKKEA